MNPPNSVFLDLHTHSSFSDGLPGVPQIEEHCQRKEMGVALTDHNEIRGALLLAGNDQIPIVPGIEVGTKEGLEFLVFFAQPADLEDFYRAAVEPHLRSRFMVRSHIPAVECLEEATARDAFVSLAHPFAFGRKSLNYHRQPDGEYKTFVPRVLDLIHAVEQFNGGVPRSVNQKADNLPQQLGKQATVGSDSHRLGTYGSVGVSVAGSMESRGESLFRELFAGEYLKVKKGTHSSVLLTVPIIAMKHTQFFMVQRHGWHARAKNRLPQTAGV